MKFTVLNILASIIGLFLIPDTTFAQEDYGCDKCSMLREEYELAESPEKEKVYAYFKQECLDTDTLFVSPSTKNNAPGVSETIQVVSKGKCIDFKEVKQIEKKTGREVMSYSISKKDTVYTIGTKSPVFKGGDEALIKFLSKNIEYPEQAKNSNITGTVYLRLVISSHGLVTEVKVKRSPDERLSTEAIRVVKSMPAWEPGEYKNKPVSMVFVLPVRFALK